MIHRIILAAAMILTACAADLPGNRAVWTYEVPAFKLVTGPVEKISEICNRNLPARNPEITGCTDLINRIVYVPDDEAFARVWMHEMRHLACRTASELIANRGWMPCIIKKTKEFH